MGYGEEGRQVRGACYRCGGFGHHSRFCQQPPGNQQGGKGGKRRALDGSSAPEMLPKLPGPDEPTNSKAGKWKVVIHTAGMEFLQDAKVFVEEENTGMRAWD